MTRGYVNGIKCPEFSQRTPVPWDKYLSPNGTGKQYLRILCLNVSGKTGKWKKE